MKVKRSATSAAGRPVKDKGSRKVVAKGRRGAPPEVADVPVTQPRSALKGAAVSRPQAAATFYSHRAHKEDEDDDDFGAASVSVLGVNTAPPPVAACPMPEPPASSPTPEPLSKERPAPTQPQKKVSKISVRAAAPAHNLNAANVELAMQRLFAAPEAAPTTPPGNDAGSPPQAAPAADGEASRASAEAILAVLHPKLRRPLSETLKITALTRVQQLAWKPMLDPARDVLIRSETGSGKTLAYALPLLHRLLEACDAAPVTRSTGTLIVVMVPTRELTIQVAEVVELLCRNARFLVVGAIHGGDSRHKEKARLRKGVHLLVATPGRLLDHLKTTSSFACRDLHCVVFDEADRLLDMGFERPIREIMGIIRPEKRVLVSATITRAVERLSHVTLRSPAHVGETEDVFKVPASLRQHYTVVPCKHRLVVLTVFLLSQLAAGARKIVVFCSTSDAVEFHYLLFSRAQNPFLPEEVRRAARRAAAVAAAAAGGGRGVGFKRARVATRKLTATANERGDDGNVVTFDDDELDVGGGAAAGEDEVQALLESAREAHAKGRDPATAASPNLDAATALFRSHLYKLHGNMSQVDRGAVFHSFKHTDAPGVLFCTDVAARGLDMPKIDWIVHYDPPSDERCYIHRVGRTARIGHIGDSLLFLMPHEREFAAFLERFIETKLEEKRQEGFLLFLSALDRAAPGGQHWQQSGAALQRQFAFTVTHDEMLSRVAMYAYQSYVRAYAGYPAAMKRYFAQTELHLGHVATSFAIDAKPSELRQKLRLANVVKQERALGRDTKRFKAGGSGMEVDTREEYHSTLVRRQVQEAKEYYVEERERNKNVPKLFQFTEFDA